MMGNKKFLIFILFIALITSSGSYAAEKKELVELKLRLWDIPERDVRDVSRKANLAIYENFVKTRPQIKIVKSAGISVEGMGNESAFMMSMAGGTAPDVFRMFFRQSLNYAQQGFCYPLDEYWEKWEGKNELLKDKLFRRLMDVVTIEGPDGKKHIYGIPTWYYVMGLVYRRDLFKKAGLDPDRPPQTWDELFEYAKKLTKDIDGDGDIDQFGFGLPTGFSGGWVFTDFVWQAGGEMVKQNKEGKWYATFNETPGVQALEFYKKLRWTKVKWRDKKGKLCEYERIVKYGNSLFSDELGKGEVAMIVSVPMDWGLSSLVEGQGLDPSQIGVAALPAGPGGEEYRRNFIGGEAYAINSQVKEKKVRDAAWEYIKYLASGEARKVRTKVFIESGWARFADPIDLERFGWTRYLKEMPEIWGKGYAEMREHGWVEPHCPNYQNIQTAELANPIDTVMLDRNADPKKLLDSCAKKCNDLILGVPSKEAMKRKRIIAFILIIIAILVLGFFIKRIYFELSKTLAEEAEKKEVTSGKRKSFLFAWIIMLPALLTILIWSYYPLLKGSLMAFYDYRILGGGKLVFLDNFIMAFSPFSLTDNLFWKAMWNTLLYVFLSLALGFFVPIFLAILLAEVPRGKMLFRVLFYLPSVTSGLVILFMWKKLFFDPSANGFFNQILNTVHLPIQSWLNDPKLAMLCIIIPGIWGGAGAGSLIYLAALKSIPDEIYEAADLDGASTFRKIFSITFPQLKPLIIINFVGAFIGSFHAMQNILVMTGGGPVNATYVIGIDIFYNAFLYLKFGYATAEAWVLGAMLIGFTMYQLRILREVKFKSAEG